MNWEIKIEEEEVWNWCYLTVHGMVCAFLWKRNQQFSNCDFTCQNRLKWTSEIKDVVEWAPMILSYFTGIFEIKHQLLHISLNICSYFLSSFVHFYWNGIKIEKKIQWKITHSLKRLRFIRIHMDSISIIPIHFRFHFH